MNSTREPVQVSCLTFGILECFVATISAIVNGLLLIVLYRNPFKSFRRPFSVLIIGLVMTDFLKGLIADSITVWMQFHCAFGKATWLTEDWNFYTVLDYMLDNSATILVTLFAGDRLLAVAAPLFYRNHITTKKVAVAVLCVWLYAFSFSLLQFSGITDEAYDLVDCCLHIIAPMVVMIIIHGLIYSVLQKRSKVETTTNASHQIQETPSWVLKNQRLEKNFRYVASIITLILAISQLPWLSIVLVKSSCKSCTEVYWFETYDQFAGFALSLTSAINPILYCWRLKEYRRALKALVTCRRIQPTSSLEETRNKNSIPNLNVNSNIDSRKQADLNSPGIQT